jgi:branched-chain amino acid transport system permease protein
VLTRALAAVGIDLPGARQVLYGICLLFVVIALPGGVWPWLARRLRLLGEGP